MGLDTTGAHRLGMTGSQAPISAMTGHRCRRRVRSEPAYRDYAAEVAEAAQYSAVPYSAMPYSASPYSIAPQSVAPNGVAAHTMAPAQVSPQSIAPYSAVPYSAMPYSTVPYQRSMSPDDLYSTGSMPRAAYPDYESAAPEALSSDLPRLVGFGAETLRRPSGQSSAAVPGRGSPADPARPAAPSSRRGRRHRRARMRSLPAGGRIWRLLSRALLSRWLARAEAGG